MFTTVVKKLPLITCLGFSWTSFYIRENLLFFSILLKLNTITSLFFWMDIDQSRNTMIHKIDGIFAKLSIGSIIFYKVFIEHSNIMTFVLTTNTMLCFFALSHLYSNQKWGGFHHISTHTSAHIFAVISIYYAFLHDASLHDLPYRCE